MKMYSVGDVFVPVLWDKDDVIWSDNVNFLVILSFADNVLRDVNCLIFSRDRNSGNMVARVCVVPSDKFIKNVGKGERMMYFLYWQRLSDIKHD